MGYLRNTLNWFLTGVAWWLGDWFGWRVPMAVYPPLLRGKVAIVSGANAGLGLETTKALLQQGATVVMACRSLEHGHVARGAILAERRNHGPVGGARRRLVVLHLDLERFAAIRSFVDDFHALGLPLHVLVNNAGVHLKEHKHVDCGFERTAASDWFGHVYLTELLLDDLKACAPSRVVNVASFAEVLGLLYTRTIPWDDLRGARLHSSGEEAYVKAKTYLLMSGRELARRLEGSGVDVIAVHPGIADTTWYLKSKPASDDYWFAWVIHRVRGVAPWVRVGQPAASGAIPLIYASMAPELAGASSAPASRGLVDRLCRVLFGGRLVYVGPSYAGNFLVLNFFNAWRCTAANPWVYNKAACARVYEAGLALIDEAERELGLRPRNAHTAAAATQQPLGQLAQLAQQRRAGADGAHVQRPAAATGGAASADSMTANGSDSTTTRPISSATATAAGLKQHPAAAAPAGADGVDEALALSGAAQPLRGA